MRLLLTRGAGVGRDRGLIGACYGPSYECVKTLLEHGDNPNAVDEYNTPALSRCCHHPQVTELLLEHGANPNNIDATGRTALHRILSSHYHLNEAWMDCARKLLDYGADVTIADNAGRTALDLAGRYPEALALCEEYRDRNSEHRVACSVCTRGCATRTRHTDSMIAAA